MNEVGSALVFSRRAAGIIPAGSGNGLARELGIPLQPAARSPQRSAACRASIDAGEIGRPALLQRCRRRVRRPRSPRDSIGRRSGDSRPTSRLGARAVYLPARRRTGSIAAPLTRSSLGEAVRRAPARHRRQLAAIRQRRPHRARRARLDDGRAGSGRVRGALALRDNLRGAAAVQRQASNGCAG